MHLSPAGTERPIEVGTQVVWRRRVASNLRTFADAGMGLSIREAPASYFELLRAASAPPPRPPQAQRALADETSSSFLMRMRKDGSPRTRNLCVQASDESDARQRALQRSGAGWSVIGVEPV